MSSFSRPGARCWSPRALMRPTGYAPGQVQVGRTEDHEAAVGVLVQFLSHLLPPCAYMTSGSNRSDRRGPVESDPTPAPSRQGLDPRDRPTYEAVTQHHRQVPGERGDQPVLSPSQQPRPAGSVCDRAFQLASHQPAIVPQAAPHAATDERSVRAEYAPSEYALPY